MLVKIERNISIKFNYVLPKSQGREDDPQFWPISMRSIKCFISLCPQRQTIVYKTQLPLSSLLNCKGNLLYGPIPSGSQDTSLPSSEPRAAPDCLPRICPDRIRLFIVFLPENGSEFVQWWLQTDFGKKKQIPWDAKQAAQCWENFDKVALEKDGKPGVMCQQYRKVLNHPGWAQSGTSSMNKQYNGIICWKEVSATGKKPNIKLALEHAAQNATVRGFDERVIVDPISDDEEDEGLSTELRATSHAPSAKALGKRLLRNIAEDAESDQEDDSEVTSLPEMQH